MKALAIHLLPCALIIVFSLFAVGCGDLYHKMVYDTATFSGPVSRGYSRMVTGEQDAGSHLQHERISDVCIRLPDGTVYELSKLLEKDLAQRGAHRETYPSGLTLYFLHPSHSTIHFRNGELVGAVLADGIELSKNKNGPFVKLPLSAGQVRDLLGEPKKETTFRGPFRWN